MEAFDNHAWPLGGEWTAVAASTTAWDGGGATNRPWWGQGDTACKKVEA
jgi:hypothetical protein